MTNKEIDAYLRNWIKVTKNTDTKDKVILGCVVSITVLLAEIAKRLPEVNALGIKNND